MPLIKRSGTSPVSIRKVISHRAHFKQFNVEQRNTHLKNSGNNILMNDDKQRIIEIADYLGVPFTSLLIRMKELKLFKYHSMDQYISLTMGDMEQAVKV
jgi:hypothetical protein